METPRHRGGSNARLMEHFPLVDAGESELVRGSRSGQGPHEVKPSYLRVLALLPVLLLPCPLASVSFLRSRCRFSNRRRALADATRHERETLRFRKTYIRRCSNDSFFGNNGTTSGCTCRRAILLYALRVVMRAARDRFILLSCLLPLQAHEVGYEAEGREKWEGKRREEEKHHSRLGVRARCTRTRE